MGVCVVLGPDDPPVDPAEVGGKGAGVARLIGGSFPVPPAAVITTAAYRAAVSDPPLRALLEALRHGSAEVSADVVDAAFLAAPLPAGIEEEIVAGARRVADGSMLAVRSSATVEDLAAASFAGQYRSVLNVPPEQVLRAVRLVWASLWHPAPRAYRRAQGLSDERLEMAVLIMRMVAAVRAGVAFTLDPAQENPAVRIEAVDGLGEALVSGSVRPSAWTASHTDLVGALHDAPVPVQQVASLALDVARAFAAPQDIEWAWDGEKLWLVQARPITALGGRGDGFDTPVDQAELTTAGIAETLPGVLPPLVWQLASFTVEEALRRVLDDLGALDDSTEPHAFIRRVRGRAALDMDRLRRAARHLPHGSAEEIEVQYFGASDHTLSGGRRPPSVWRRLRAPMHDLRVMRARKRAVLEAETILVAAAEIDARRPATAGLDMAALLAYRSRLLDLGARAAAAELGVAAAAAAAYERLEAMLRRYLDGGEAAARRWAQHLTTGAGAVDVTPHASMAVFAGPTWAERNIPVPDLLRRRSSSPREPLGELEAWLTGRPRWRRFRLLTGQLIDIRVHLLRRAVDEALAMLRRRERTKAAVLRIGGEVRSINLEIGRRLSAAGVLPDPLDVDLLSDLELRGERVPPTPAELDRRRRWLTHYAEDGPLPERFVGHPLPERPEDASADALRGAGASAGRYTGTARFVHNPQEEIEAGAVLLAESTDASWSPLFLRAGAVVVAQGGPLSHAAIVARELGLPAVVGTAGPVASLDGRRVTVDGDRGIVTVHSPDRYAGRRQAGGVAR